MTVHTSPGEIIRFIVLFMYGVGILGAGVLIYDIVTGIRDIMRRRRAK